MSDVQAEAPPVEPAAVETPAAELPNAVPAAVDSTTAPDSASNAAGADTTSPTGASSAEPLHVRVAQHLEAIYTLVRDAGL